MKRVRTVLLFVPGGRLDFMRKAASCGADTVILDLEDAVVPAEKENSRRLLEEALEALSFGGQEVVVRINPLHSPWGRADLAAAARLAGVDTIMIPKASPEAVREVEQHLSGSAKGLICLVETALGLLKAFEIASASPRINGLMLGAEDLAAEMNMNRTPSGTGLDFARWTVSLAAHAAHVQPIDTPFTEIADLEGLKADTVQARSCGFTAKACITPRHVSLIREIFTPTAAEVEQARKIVRAAAEAESDRRGALQVDGKMVDLPVVLRARQILIRAGEVEGDAR